MNADPRKIAKFAAKTVVQTVAGSAIARAVVTLIPATGDNHVAVIVGAVGGYFVAEELEPHTDAVVDAVADAIHKQKVHNITTA